MKGNGIACYFVFRLNADRCMVLTSSYRCSMARILTASVPLVLIPSFVDPGSPTQTFGTATILFVTTSLVGRRDFTLRNRVIAPGLCFTRQFDLAVRECDLQQAPDRPAREPSGGAGIGESRPSRLSRDPLEVSVAAYLKEPRIQIVDFAAHTMRTVLIQD